MTGQVFVFSGQGSQYQNMGKDLFEISEKAIGFSRYIT